MDHSKTQEQPTVRTDHAGIDTTGKKMKIEVRRLERIAPPGGVGVVRTMLNALMGNNTIS